MIAGLISVALFGIAIGAFTGWFVFDSLMSAIGIGCGMGAGICGLMVAFGSDRPPETNAGDDA